MFSSTKVIEKDFNENDNKVWKSISENNQEKCISGRDHTDLFKQGVKFLNGSILITTYLKIHKKTENITEWSIRFFVGSPHERCLCIYVDKALCQRSQGAFDWLGSWELTWRSSSQLHHAFGMRHATYKSWTCRRQNTGKLCGHCRSSPRAEAP